MKQHQVFKELRTIRKGTLIQEDEDGTRSLLALPKNSLRAASEW